MAATTKVNFTGNSDIDGLLYDYKWSDTTITFSFPTQLSFYGYTVTGFEAMNSAQIADIRAMLDAIETYTNLEFVEITETASTHATIRFGEEANAGTAYAWLPTTLEQGGDVWLNKTDFNDPKPGSWSYVSLLHEISHALGLDHGHDGKAALTTDHDSLEYSIMTYRSFVGADLNGYTVRDGSYPIGLMMADIEALQYLYGADYGTNSGNSVYTFSPTTGVMSINGVAQLSSAANKIFRTVWDGGGNDTYDLSNYTTNLQINLEPGGWSTFSTAQLADLGGGFYPNKLARGNLANAELYQGNVASLIENAIGGTGNDTIIGNQANNVLNGNGGNDTLEGGLGNDTLIGGAGIDYCILDVNRVTCTVTYDALTDTFTLSSLLGIDTATGIEFFTFLDGTYAAASLAGPDEVAPTLVSSSPADEAGAVAVSANLVLNFSETMLRGTGNIVIYKADGTVALTIAASDTAQVAISGSKVTINPASNLDAGTGYYVLIDGGAFTDAAGNDYAGIASATALNFTTLAPGVATDGADTLDGTELADVISALGGNDVLNGLGGDDTLDGGAGADTMNGGTGNDTYIVDNSGDRAVEGADTGTDLVLASVSFTLGSNVENLTLTGTSAINGTGNSSSNRMIGNAAANTLDGSSGDDTLFGLGGADTLLGGIGNDTLWGGTGKDTLTGGAGKDTFYFDAFGTANVDKITDFNVKDDTIGLDAAFFTRLAVGNLTSAAYKAGTKATDSSDRIIYDSKTGNLFYDPDGNGSQAQQLIATLSKSLGITYADFVVTKDASAIVGTPPTTPSEPTDPVVPTDPTPPGDATEGADLLTGTAQNDVLSGLGGDDTLFGLGGSDTLLGGDGTDALWGGTGKDTLTGGAGKDTFFFDAFGSANADRITDFNVKDDTIGLDQSYFTKLGLGGLAVAAYKAGTRATDSSDRIIYDSKTGNLYYDPDGSGRADQQLIATLDKGLGITHADFLIVA
jgi:serralysin